MKNLRKANKLEGVPNLWSDLFKPDPVLSTLWDHNLAQSDLPQANIKEGRKAFTVELAAPGYAKEDFHVQVRDGVLIVEATREQKEKKVDEEYTRREYAYESFTRSFTLPDHVDAKKIQAQYKNGILGLELPKIPGKKDLPVQEIKIT